MDKSSKIKSLEKMVRQADKLAALGTMAAGMAHEIKNPLASIKVMSQLAIKKIEDPEFKKKYTEIMSVEISRIDRIIEGMLSHARTKKQSIEAADINALIKEALFFFAGSIKEHKINAVFAPQEDIVIQADAQQIFQVFLNLMQNAISSMAKGGQLNITARKTSKSHLPGKSVVITVADTGRGIPNEHLSKIFDPFFSLRYGGTGLGLTIVHGIVESHNGLIDVDSEEGKGTTFTIIFPENFAEEIRSEEQIGQENRNRASHRILHRGRPGLQDRA
ncbi:MAG: ATP-binding protein [Candidatus Saganbacteria bacterium]|nr:ATP-binding protein [Candidatus Saganbacteria bacterium]